MAVRIQWTECVCVRQSRHKLYQAANCKGMEENSADMRNKLSPDDKGKKEECKNELKRPKEMEKGKILHSWQVYSEMNRTKKKGKQRVRCARQT